MIWNDSLETCRGMFLNTGNIISIDLTRFDFSSVTDMGAFFQNCWHLKSINMKNHEALNVQNMEYMCAYCH